MTIEEELKTRVKDADAELLQQAVNDAEGMILDVCNRTSVPARMRNLQLALAEIYAYRMLAEGEESRSQGNVSVSYSYAKDIPGDLLRRILAHRKLKQAVIAHADKGT